MRKTSAKPHPAPHSPSAPSPPTKTPSAKSVEALKSDEQVKDALEKVKASDPSPAPKAQIGVRAGWIFGALVLLAAAFAANRAWTRAGETRDWIEKGVLVAAVAVCVVAIEQVVEVATIRRLHDNAARFNFKRILRLVTVLALVGGVVKFLFVTWYTALASLGVASLILGFALQTPITSFIGWIYILVRKPYRVGDRIRIEDATGDVIDVSYLDTTLWEFGGEYLTGDHPSGRVIKFPNSRVLNVAVYNYTWPLFPYIWNEIKLNLAYESDLEFVAGVMRDVATEELGPAMVERIATYRQLLAETPVDELTVREHPSVAFRSSDNTWIEAIVRYLVEPKAAGRTKTAILKKTLDRLNASPDRVLFPKGNAR